MNLYARKLEPQFKDGHAAFRPWVKLRWDWTMADLANVIGVLDGEKMCQLEFKVDE